MNEGTLLRCAYGPVFALHDAVIGCRVAKRDSVSLIIGAHASKSVGPSDPSFELVNVRRLQMRACRLIVAAIFIQSGNWVRFGATVRGHRFLVITSKNRGGMCERDCGGSAGSQNAPATEGRRRVGMACHRAPPIAEIEVASEAEFILNSASPVRRYVFLMRY